MKLNLSQKKFIDEVTLQKIIKIGINFGERLNTIDTKCIDDFSEDKLYLKGEACYKDGYIYRAVVSTQGAWVDNRWVKVGDDITELDINTIKSYLNLSQDELDNLQNLIDDAQITLTKTHSSSKIYMDIQQCLEDSKTYTLKEISKLSGASYKVVTSTSEMTSKSIIYLLANATNYDMYIVEENGTATKIGNTDINLSQYLTKTEIETDYLKKTDADGKYATITTVDGKVNKVDISTTISSTPSDEKVVSEKAVKTELDNKVDNTIILKTADEVNSFDRAYQSFIVYNFIADAIGLPGSPSSTWFCIHFSHSKGYTYPSQIAFEYAGLERIMYRTSIKGVWGTWRKISTTGVKDIPKTNIAPADTTKFVGFKGNSLCNYCVQNGICYVSIWGVQVTVTGRVNTGVILPLPKSGFFGGGYLTGGGDAITHAYAHTIPETGELKFNVKDANTALYGAFSYPVAES